jgi:predicted dehydrogenase
MSMSDRKNDHRDPGQPDRPIRIGLIGCGRMAGKHLRTMASIPQVALAAVSDVAAERMEEAAGLYRREQRAIASMDERGAGPGDEIRRFASYRELIASGEVDAVVITASSVLHGAVTLDAIRAGKPVMVEKPLALSLKEAELIRSESGRLRVPVLVCHQLRYRPLFRQLKRAIDQGGIGEILYAAASLRIRRDEDYYSAAPWRGKWDLDGGMLINQGIHLLDLMLWYLGDPRQATGRLMRLKDSGKETEDAALAMIRFSSGAVGWVDANVVTYPRNLEQSLYICGTRGTVAIGGPALDRLVRWHVDGMTEQEAEALASDQTEHREMYLDFVRAVRDGSQPLMNAAEGARALELIFALYQSHLEQQAVGRPRGDFSPKELNASEVWNR